MGSAYNEQGIYVWQVQLRFHISHAKAAENQLPGGHMLLFFFKSKNVSHCADDNSAPGVRYYAIIGALHLVEFSFIKSRKWEIICPVRLFVVCSKWW